MTIKKLSALNHPQAFLAFLGAAFLFMPTQTLGDSSPSLEGDWIFDGHMVLKIRGEIGTLFFGGIPNPDAVNLRNIHRLGEADWECEYFLLGIIRGDRWEKCSIKMVNSQTILINRFGFNDEDDPWEHIRVGPSGKRIGGFYAFNETSTSQDQDGTLQDLAPGLFSRVSGSGSGKPFSDVCRPKYIEQDYTLLLHHCRYVIDWEGRRHSCEASADDGSRMAYCSIDQPPGYYAWQETRTDQDQEENLRKRGNLKRLTGGYGGQFGELCSKIGLQCENVVDWEGRNHYCTASAEDGSRMAYCK